MGGTGSEPEVRRFRAAQKRNFLSSNLAASVAFYLLWGCGRDEGAAACNIDERLPISSSRP
jgi:hypothetical protein